MFPVGNNIVIPEDQSPRSSRFHVPDDIGDRTGSEARAYCRKNGAEFAVVDASAGSRQRPIDDVTSSPHQVPTGHGYRLQPGLRRAIQPPQTPLLKVTD